MVIQQQIDFWLAFATPASVVASVIWQTILTGRLRAEQTRLRIAAERTKAEADRVRNAIKLAADIAAMSARSAATHASTTSAKVEEVAKSVENIASNTNHMRELAETAARVAGEEAGRLKEIERREQQDRKRSESA